MNRMNSFNLSNNNNSSQAQNRTNFLNQYIGRRCTCEFYVGTDIVKKTGLLNSVGADYITLTSTNNPEELLVGSLDELKFIKFY